MVFVNTHCGLILCTLNLLRTLYVCPLRALLLGCPTLLFPLPPSFLSKTVVKMLFLPLVTSLSSSSQTLPRSLQEYTSCSCSHSLLCPPSSYCPLSSISSLQTLISCDTMHHGPSLCMDCVRLAQTSGRRASVTLCLNALLRVQVAGPHKRYPKAKIQIFNF